MSEKKEFVVDSQGQVTHEVAETEEQFQSYGLKKGAAVLIEAEGVAFGDSASPGLDGAQYYVDPVGRVIDTRTGQLVTEGSGKVIIPISDLAKREREENQK